jgi:hypothetical protein
MYRDILNKILNFSEEKPERIQIEPTTLTDVRECMHCSALMDTSTAYLFCDICLESTRPFHYRGVK